VAPLTRADVEELWGLMAVLEGCAALAAGRLPKPRRDAVADALDAINDEYAGAVHDHPRDPDQLSDLQTRFHQTLVDAGAGPRLQLAHRTLHPHVERYQWAYGNFVRESRFDVSVTEHRGIVRRLRRGDAESLRSAVEEHWRRAARRAASLLNGE
jgi:DNA-binding GntR family transcriptional regulator